MTLVRREARRLAEENHRPFILTDGPPGIGCPVISSMGDARAVLLVAEPTVSGKHDLERVATLADHFRLPVLVLVNKADLHWEMAREIEQFCVSRSYPFLGHLPFDPDFTRAQVEGKTIMEYDNKRLQALLTEVWEQLRSEIDSLTRQSH